MTTKNSFSQCVTVFHERVLPEQACLSGYSALINAYHLEVPLPDVLFAIGKKHKKYQVNRWSILTPRHTPHDSLYGHLIFALKYEGIDLAILNALFKKIDADEIIAIIQSEPTGSYSRRIWFLYEWLLDKQLDIPDSLKANMVDVLDTTLQYPGLTRLSKRHLVRNNLPGLHAFCPLIRKTEKLEQFIQMNLRDKACVVLGTIHPDVLLRAAAFMLLKDSKASFAIEGETPPQTRAERWGQAISQAGIHPLSYDELIRLQEIIIADFRFTHYGYRNEGGFVGEHDRSNGFPIPDHISARYNDLYLLMDGLIATNELLINSEMDPILVAALIGFGFVFIHPFEDGNGRIHRYLIHHVLAEMKFTSHAIVFPVSSVILEKLNDYRKVLESFSRPRLALTKWRPTEKGNVEVLNDTIDFFRYFDATKQAEFLYECIQETIEKTLPDEVNYLKNYDEMKQFINQFIDMPNRVVDLLIRFLHQEQGVLSKRARRKEFNALTENEVTIIEKKYAAIFLNEKK